MSVLSVHAIIGAVFWVLFVLIGKTQCHRLPIKRPISIVTFIAIFPLIGLGLIGASVIIGNIGLIMIAPIVEYWDWFMSLFAR